MRCGCIGAALSPAFMGIYAVSGRVLAPLGGCRIDDVPFPRPQLWPRTATSADDLQHGAGLSADRYFKNVKGVTTPQYGLFFEGDLAPGKRLTRVQFDAVQRQVITKNVDRGVTFHTFPGAASDTDVRGF